MKNVDIVYVSCEFLLSQSYNTDEKLLYIVLMSISDKQNIALASFRELSRLSGLSINTVQKVILSLQVQGRIKKYVSLYRGLPNIYQLTRSSRDQMIPILLGVIYNRLISHTAKIVYAILLVYQQNNEQECYPSEKAIAKHLNKSIRTVQRTISELRDCHAISFTRRYTHNEYMLHDSWVVDNQKNCEQPKRIWKKKVI